jgi:hypothetical protein
MPPKRKKKQNKAKKEESNKRLKTDHQLNNLLSKEQEQALTIATTQIPGIEPDCVLMANMSSEYYSYPAHKSLLALHSKVWNNMFEVVKQDSAKEPYVVPGKLTDHELALFLLHVYNKFKITEQNYEAYGKIYRALDCDKLHDDLVHFFKCDAKTLFPEMTKGQKDLLILQFMDQYKMKPKIIQNQCAKVAVNWGCLHSKYETFMKDIHLSTFTRSLLVEPLLLQLEILHDQNEQLSKLES